MTARLRCSQFTMHLPDVGSMQKPQLKDLLCSSKMFAYSRFKRTKSSSIVALFRKVLWGSETETSLPGLHMQLLPRLAAWRGRWQNDRLQDRTRVREERFCEWGMGLVASGSVLWSAQLRSHAAHHVVDGWSSTVPQRMAFMAPRRWQNSRPSRPSKAPN